MAKTSVSEEEIRAMEDYLRGYAFHQKMIEMDEMERSFFYEVRVSERGSAELPLARVRLFEIRHFIMSMENGMEKLLLYYHYVKGESVERCGDLLGVSRSTVFRMKHRALAFAVLHKKRIDEASVL